MRQSTWKSLVAIGLCWFAAGLIAACTDGGTVTAVGDDDTYGEGDDDTTGDDDTAVDDDTTGDDDTVDDEYWSQAELVVHSPESGAFFPLGTPVHLEADVLDGEGLSTGWDDIHWTTDQDAVFEYVGALGDVEDFPVGDHTITAKTELPNGDRLTYAVGGVLVQHEYAGVYAGTVNVGIDTQIQGYPVSASCIGSIDFVVDAYGETLNGTGSCIASVAGLFDLPLDLVIDGTIDGSAVGGTLGVDVAGWFQLPSPFEGEFVASDQMQGSFYYDLSGTIVSGDIDAHRVALTP